MGDETFQSVDEENRNLNTREERENRRNEHRLGRIAELKKKSDQCDDVLGYVYREADLDNGKSSAGRIRNVLDDYEFGIVHGPGKFTVAYMFYNADGSTSRTSVKYQIGYEYADLHRQYCEEHNKPFKDISGQFRNQNQNQNQKSGLSELLNPEKIESLVALTGVAKSIFGNNNNDLLEKIIANQSNQNSSSLSEAIVIESIKGMRRENETPALPPQANSIRDQLDLFKEIKEITEPEPEKDDKVSKYIEMALDNLPGILKEFNGDEKKAAEHIKKENILVRTMLKRKGVRDEFYKAAVENYGVESAKRFARGFGIDVNSLPSSNTKRVHAEPAPQVQRAGSITF